MKLNTTPRQIMEAVGAVAIAVVLTFLLTCTRQEPTKSVYDETDQPTAMDLLGRIDELDEAARTLERHVWEHSRELDGYEAWFRQRMDWLEGRVFKLEEAAKPASKRHRSCARRGCW